MQIKTVLTIHFTLVRMVTKKTNGAEDAGKKEYLHTLVGAQSGAATMEILTAESRTTI